MLNRFCCFGSNYISSCGLWFGETTPKNSSGFARGEQLPYPEGKKEMEILVRNVLHVLEYVWRSGITARKEWNRKIGTSDSKYLEFFVCFFHSICLSRMIGPSTCAWVPLPLLCISLAARQRSGWNPALPSRRESQDNSYQNLQTVYFY